MTPAPPDPDQVLARFLDALERRDLEALRARSAPRSWERAVVPWLVDLLARELRPSALGSVVQRGARALAPCVLSHPQRRPRPLTVLLERDAAGVWLVAGADSDPGILRAWLEGHIESHQRYTDLPLSPLGAALAERVLAARAAGGDVVAAVGDPRGCDARAQAALREALGDPARRVCALPSREHERLGRLAVGFEWFDLSAACSEELWLVLEDHGQGPRVLCTSTFMSLALILGDYGAGWPTPAPARTPVPEPPRAPSDAFERAVLDATSAATASGSGDADEDLFARAVGSTLGPPT